MNRDGRQPEVAARRECRLGGFHLREFVLPGGHRLPRHEHEDPMLVLMYDGTFRGEAVSEEYAIGAGETIVAPAARNHRGYTGPRGSRAVLVALEDPRRVRVPLGAWDRVRRCGGPEIRRLAARVDRELRLHDTAAELALEGALLDLLALCVRAWFPGRRASKLRWVHHARDLVEAQIDAPPSIAEIADTVGVSPAHLHRGFRRVFGCSIGTYVRSRRLERAASLLRDDTLPIAQIALQTGFYDQSHLARAFRAHFGVSPGRYRRYGDDA